MSDACPDCGGGMTVSADATVQCTKCGRVFADLSATAEARTVAEVETTFETEPSGLPQATSQESIDWPLEERPRPTQAWYRRATRLARRPEVLVWRRTSMAVGGAIVLLGSIVLLSSLFLSLVVAKGLAEGVAGEAITWAQVMHAMLSTGPGMAVCFGLFIIMILGLYSLYMSTMMIRGFLDSRVEFALSAVIIGIAGIALSLLTIGGLIGAAGAGLILVGGLVGAFSP